MVENKRVFIAGVWDLFHVGHLNAIMAAEQLASYLIVGVVTDRSAFEYKGEMPIIPFEQRSKIIDSLYCVDEVVETPEQFSIKQMDELEVDIVCVGADWKDKMTLALVKLQQHMEVVYLPRTKGIDTAAIKEKIRGGPHGHDAKTG